jgi:hypothetical protein
MQKQAIWARRVTLAAIAAATLSLPMMSATQAKTIKHYRVHTAHALYLPNAQGGPADLAVGARALYGYHPNAQGGTTGGTVYPGVNGDHREHGYNGG